jgi:hypothetical protein
MTTNWMPIETAPEMEWVLVAECKTVDIAILDSGKWIELWKWDEQIQRPKPVECPFEPTYWMPLPEPPEDS